MKTSADTYALCAAGSSAPGKILLGIAVDSPQRSEDYKRKARPEGEQPMIIIAIREGI